MRIPTIEDLLIDNIEESQSSSISMDAIIREKVFQFTQIVRLLRMKMLKSQLDCVDIFWIVWIGILKQIISLERILLAKFKLLERLHCAGAFQIGIRARYSRLVKEFDIRRALGNHLLFQPMRRPFVGGNRLLIVLCMNVYRTKVLIEKQQRQQHKRRNNRNDNDNQYNFECRYAFRTWILLNNIIILIISPKSEQHDADDRRKKGIEFGPKIKQHSDDRQSHQEIQNICNPCNDLFHHLSLILD